MSARVILLSGIAMIGLLIQGVFLLNRLTVPYFTFENPYPRQNKGDEELPKRNTSLKEQDGKYIYSYSFQDQNNKLQYWKWQADKNYVDKLNNSFGVPPSIFQEYTVTDEVLKQREKQLRDGMFKEYPDGLVDIDYDLVISKHLPVVAPIYSLGNLSLSGISWQNKIDVFMKFCQDLEYKVPPNELNGKEINGCFPPSLALTKSFGDCDTKTLLMATLLASEPENYKCIILFPPDHALLGIKGVPKPYQKFYTYQGEKYIYCEVAGPSRTFLGEPFEPYTKFSAVKPVKVDLNFLHNDKSVASYFPLENLVKDKEVYSFDGGAFAKNDLGWEERADYDDRVVYYKELSRDASHILLKDENSDVLVRLPIKGGISKISWEGDETWEPLYEVSKSF